MEKFKDYVAVKKAEIKQQLDKEVKKPKLVIINVGNDQASQVYVKGKLKDCAEVGIVAELKHFEDSITENFLLDFIEALNNDDNVTGFIVQLPLPKHIHEEKIIEAIKPIKDVDGFSKLHITEPATPQGIINYLVDRKYQFNDKNAVILGRSNIVGKPIARLLLDKNCNVIQLHSKTSEQNKRLFLENADLIITATGKLNLIDHSYKLKSTAWIIDVGMNRDENGKLIGDCARDLPVELQSEVPGSVGLLTRLTLITNLLKLFYLQKKIKSKKLIV